MFILTWFVLWFSVHTLLMDEPDFTDRSPSAVHTLYLQEKAAAPLWLNFFTCRWAAPYLGSADAFSADYYPFYRSTSTKTGLRRWDREVARCVRLAHAYGKPRPLMVAQAFGRLHDGPFVWRCPTAYEHARLVADARRLGARGVLWWRPPQHRYWC